MLTGLLERSSGDAEIYGHKISNGMDPIRRLIGLCPQVAGFSCCARACEFDGPPFLSLESAVNL
jgi:hypothetical protein